MVVDVELDHGLGDDEGHGVPLVVVVRRCLAAVLEGHRVDLVLWTRISPFYKLCLEDLRRAITCGKTLSSRAPPSTSARET